jgi:phosphate transport system permease protein
VSSESPERGESAHATAASRARTRTQRKRRVRTGGAAMSLVAQGQPMVWLTAGGLVLCLAMVIGLLVLVFYQGFATFWPGRLVELRLHDGSLHLGEVTRVEDFRPGPEVIAAVPEQRRAEVERLLAERDGRATRRLLRTGNYELTNEHFRWVSDFEVAAESHPQWAFLVERMAWGRFYGTPRAFVIDGAPAASEPEAIWQLFRQHHDQVRARWRERRGLEQHEMGAVNAHLEQVRLGLREV